MENLMTDCHTIPECRERIRQIEKEIADAENSIRAIESETDALIPAGRLTALDELRKLESRESEADALNKRKDRLQALRKGIAALKAERLAVEARQKELDAQADEIANRIQAAGDRAIEAQRAFWQAIADLDKLKSESSQWQQIVGDRSHPLYRGGGDDCLILSKMESSHDGIPRYWLRRKNAIALSSIYHEIGGIEA